MNELEWEPIKLSGFIGFNIGCIGLLVLVLASEPGFVFLLDHANLLFHEAGHPIIGLFSQRLETYGGTLGQLTFPVVLAISFWRQGQALSFAGAVIWFFENWLNIARYMADARDLLLPLVGGGVHDWNTIFARWNILLHDTQIASAVRTCGWIGMILPFLWIWWRFWQDRNRVVATDNSGQWDES
jgi:hypothetical protein